MIHEGNAGEHNKFVYYCKKCKLPPMVECDDLSVIDLDEIGIPSIHMMKVADCVSFCAGRPRWIIETKKTSLDDIVLQLEDTFDRISNGDLGHLIKEPKFNPFSLKALVIMEKGMGGESYLFERDDKYYLQSHDKVHIKIKNTIPIIVLTKREVEQMLQNAKRFRIAGDN